jgi:hypothetical protein
MPRVVPRLERAMSLGLRAELAFRLRRTWNVRAESIEVVHVERAQVVCSVSKTLPSGTFSLFALTRSTFA